MKTRHTEVESELQRRWAKRHQQAGYVTTTDGTRLRILFAGWRNSGRGPDFQGAIFKAPGQPAQRGDVELHRDSAGWFEHGHDRDQHYAGVTLHVVGATRPVKADGLYPQQTAILSARSTSQYADPRPCVQHKTTPPIDVLRVILREAGEARFAARVSTFSREIIQWGPDQALFRAILTALGYAKNQSPFQRLAETTTYACLHERLATASPAAEAALFGNAGLLPSQRELSAAPTEYTVRLERQWAASGLASHLEPSGWQLFRVRPENHPVRRIAAASALLSQHRGPGLAGALSSGTRAATPQQLLEHCRSYLTLEAGTYWTQHYDFGRRAPLGQLLIGPARTAVIIVNVLLPFLAATAQGRAGAAELVREVYTALPGGEENQITARMRQMLRLPSELHLSACEEQGLIALYKQRCSGLFCAGCALA